MRRCRWTILLLVATLPGPAAGQSRHSATIHWQRVPLRDAIGRLEGLFGETVFLDRRVDPNWRVSLDIQASSIEEVLTPLAAERELGVTRLGEVVYFGPRLAAARLPALAAKRNDEAAASKAQPMPFGRKRRLTWPRLVEPRALVTSLMKEQGWRVIGAQKIPHDLWPAGELPELALAEQMTLLLIGFDLTFEIRPGERAIAIVPLEANSFIQPLPPTPAREPPPRASQPPARTRQVYTLRVKEQPVGVVLRELSKRLHWAIEIDEAAVQAAGLSLDARVSFAVEDVEQDELLEALLRPAGLGFRREGQRVRIVPRPAPAQ
jgi:hypothetical protein